MQPVFQNYTYERRLFAPALQRFGANESFINNMTTSLDLGFATSETLQFLAFTLDYKLDLSGPSNATD